MKINHDNGKQKRKIVITLDRMFRFQENISRQLESFRIILENRLTCDYMSSDGQIRSLKDCY